MYAPSTLLIHTTPDLDRAFQALGCTTLTLQPDSGQQVLDLEERLHGMDFTPELIVQRENLSCRLLVSGLDRFDCPKIFWGLDSHLNAHWHAAYARLFDISCATQKKWIPAYRQLGAQDVRWLPWYAPAGTWQPWSAREHGFSFVGRFSSQRPARRWMCEHLQQRFAHANPSVRDDISYAQMLELYGRTKIVPNESIFNESNLRLFEAATRGCVVLNPDIGPELEELFEPGREIDIYDSVVDLEDLLARHLADERRAQAMGRAAFERVQAEHLVLHRAQTLLDYAADATANAATGQDAQAWFTVTLARLMESGHIFAQPATVEKQAAHLPQTGTTMASRLRLLATDNSPECAQRIMHILHTVLTDHLFRNDMELNLTASMAALRSALEAKNTAAITDADTNMDAMARTFLLRQLQAGGRTSAPPAPGRENLLLAWARLLHRAGKTIRAGLPFSVKNHLPGSAVECLILLLSLHPEHMEALRLMESLTHSIRGTEQARVGYLSLLTLHEPDDWRMGLELAIADLRSYRRTAGEEELRNALKAARQQEQEKHFIRALTARDPSGLLRRLAKIETENQR
jgi:hypothetical protein